MVSDFSIPVDVLVGRTWLDLPHINYFKRGDEFVIETLAVISPTVASENDTFVDVSDIHIALVDVGNSAPSPLLEQDVKIDPQVPVCVRSSLLSLINEYRDVFAKNLAESSAAQISSTWR